ncbi:hypothetical protein TWF225_011571 [Orbilia oligospora]|uniref:Uncharacterized protein n=1 Tax=Orbilia oligospora TaxID=2813651 RepID=A0A7C8PJ59_ORBOL|nr:hypothetical protein TWF751_012139 [Orbilia oligospora]KAF3192766.1 hypothetical protein TWF225_011571 [Orbilia oligospora]KAF3234614.1 hypothetical protein TWF128_002271 [Orbilia oligospora]KAF3262892.1 hypothetical protein TWF217_004174 [Orbilia oligospora]KAF3287143.1 hypothetical protein TWF132_008671 [Orbilia oligospora]
MISKMVGKGHLIPRSFILADIGAACRDLEIGINVVMRFFLLLHFFDIKRWKVKVKMDIPAKFALRKRVDFGGCVINRDSFARAIFEFQFSDSLTLEYLLRKVQLMYIRRGK